VAALPQAEGQGGRTTLDRVTPVYLEIGAKKVFACAVDWPGWCRSGKTEQDALDTLAAYAPRFAVVATAAGVRFPSRHTFDIVERVKGSATTDFGAPGSIPNVDRRSPSKRDAQKMVSLLEAAWEVFGRVVKTAPASLRKGPRGGGRDRDAIAAHVLSGEVVYARKLGTKLTEPAARDAAAVRAFRQAIVAALTDALAGTETSWPPAYAARRLTWHVVDHAWEIEDRST
jgi:hypothetical protein